MNNIPTGVQAFAVKANDCNNAVLQYCYNTGEMGIWWWPWNGGSRLGPSQIQDHRETHDMLGPGCICPMVYPSGPNFVEAAIFMLTDGPLVGQYVAGCARNKCGYLVPMEPIFVHPGVPVKCYAPRLPNEPAPPRVFHISENGSLHAILGPESIDTNERTNLSDLVPDINLLDHVLEIDAPDLVPRRQLGPSIRSAHKGVNLLLNLLDSRVHLGVTKVEFCRLFVKCDCGYIMTRRALRDHACGEGEIERVQMDLTEEE
ncbi:hypothetical protein PILCRDRAFT_13225 [Piloderma croceum F 1598]|uniref:Uncharacterized protein n=1 Tax=Piloderma croceum (strain F 1598) TaxID=765440 RepID=A0A0C3F7G6_PILCF|nr:hypothetical protein PILCRDRAFT_13225 [Piloderma croceum F 1598]